MYGQTWAGIHFPEFIRVIELLCEMSYLKKSAHGSSMRIIAAVEAYATLGEVADAMRRVFGEFSEAI